MGKAVRKATFDNALVRDLYGIKINGCVNGVFTAEELGDLLVVNWVEYSECHKCSRVKSCEDIFCYDGVVQNSRCGVKSRFIKNFVELSFYSYIGASRLAQEKLLSATYYLSEFVYFSEIAIGCTLDKGSFEFGGDFSEARAIANGLIHLREYLNLAAQDLSGFIGLYSKKAILLVEGEAEKIFLERLKWSHSLWFLDLRIEVYGGYGNSSVNRVEMNVRRYVESGYSCYMQGDKDGKNEHQNFNKLIKTGAVVERDLFVFSYDFETAIPAELLLGALHNIKLLLDVDLECFNSAVSESNSSICKAMKYAFGFDIEPYKVAVASEVAWMLNNTHNKLLQSDEFMTETELGKFLSFVSKIP